MCSLFGLIDFKECLSTHTKNKILNTLARECQVRGTDATGIAYSFNGRLRIYKRPLPARKMKIHIPHGVNVVMGHTRNIDFYTSFPEDAGLSNMAFEIENLAVAFS